MEPPIIPDTPNLLDIYDWTDNEDTFDFEASGLESVYCKYFFFYFFFLHFQKFFLNKKAPRNERRSTDEEK